MVQELIDSDQYKQATATARKLLTVSKKSADESVIDTLELLINRLKFMEREYQLVTKNLKTLESDPYNT